MKFNYKDAEKAIQGKLNSQSGIERLSERLFTKYHALIEKEIKKIMQENQILDLKELSAKILLEDVNMRMDKKRTLSQTCFIYLKDKLVSRIEMHLDGIKVYRYKGEQNEAQKQKEIQKR